jgi:hypothetical protein
LTILVSKEKIEIRIQIQVTKEILDMKQMALKVRDYSLADSLPLPHHYCRKLIVYICFHFSPLEEYLVDRFAIGYMD